MNLGLIKMSQVWISFVVIMMGEVARWLAVVIVTTPCGKFTFKERAFMGFAWTPKATVQAAVGSMVLDHVRWSLGQCHQQCCGGQSSQEGQLQIYLHPFLTVVLVSLAICQHLLVM